MKMIFTGKVSGEKTVLVAGARHTVKAQAGEQYGLIDEVTGLVPDGVEADRSGDDLILRKKEDSTEVRIEGFWEECQPGETQCTAVFNVVGENGQVTEAVLTQDGPVLENFTAGQSGTLAGGINNGIIWGGIAFGAGLAAIALAAGGGGGSSRHKRTAEEDGNGKPDDQDAALKQAQDLVAAAEGKQTEAENALTEANKDGAINQTEHDDLTGKNQAVTEAKTPAQAAVDALPDGQEKSELQNRLDAVDGITVPAVNDQDGNGKPDDQDAALKQAQDLVAAAEGKQTEAENALTEANKDGAINQTEHDDLTGKNQAVTEAKTPAQAAVDALPDGQEKSELQNRLDAVDGITVPAVNDQDGNGKPDDQDAALKQAQDLVAAAEGKQTEAENALTEANKDGAINQTEHDDLTGKNQAVTEAKTPAQAAVDALPDGQEKSELQNRLDAVDGITVPAVNDQDGNGKPDDQDAALKQAQDLVAAAEGKQTEAENALTEANKDGAINQTEHDDLTGKNQAVTEAKTPAQAAVDALPDGQEKSELQNRLDAVDGITVPAVNDQDGNGKPDDQDAALKQAQDLVAAAEGKQTEAENALTEANKDGAINQTEHDDLTGKNQAVTEAKTPAQAAVDALPDGQEKSELQNRLDAVDGITVPAVNDQDGNGKPDDQDAALKQAQDLVAAAEGKQTEAENALTEANKDGAINQTEHDDLTGKNQAVTEAKTPAQAAVDALPDGQEKSELQNRLDAVDGITVPAVNDQDGNGKPDDQDAALKQAQDLVAAAEGKQTEAENALTEANKDGAINQTEHDDLTGKNQAVTEAKTPAQAAVDALPDGQEKSELQNRLDAVDGITVPAVNDQDGNGKPDDQDAALKQAQDLVAAAEGKQTEAENALTEANKDGAINQTEHDDLTGKNQAVTEAKTPAQAAVDALPDGQEKSELQNRLDAVDGITVPAVNDQDGNGKPDDQDAALKQAQDLVAAAEGKQTEAENALTEANKDGAINQTEHDDLTGKNQAVTEAKTPAQAAVDALPDGQEKSELQNRLDAVDGITVPAVNDQDGNGKPDDQDAALKQAQDLVAAAEGKQTEAENALTEANKDGAINQTEHDDLTGKNQAVTEAKTPAQAAVDALPDGQEKSELQNRLDTVDGITVPAVNDQDGNGKPDDQDAALKQAQDLVAAAEGKQTEAENALTEANKDGAINQTEHDDLTGKNQAVTEAKTPAQAAVDALPDGQEKSELQNRLDAVDGITVPAVNDQDGNGKPDDQDAALKQAQDLVAAAEGKQTEAENALTEANKDGAINQTEHDDLTGKNQAVTEAKTPAQAAVDALPDGQEKSELQNRLDAVDGITVPAVNDQDGNGKPDDQDAALKQAQDLVAAAEGKQTEAENALTEANKDGAINQTEHDDLTGKNQAVTEAKTPAQAAVDALPDGQEKSELQNRLDAVDGITVPAVNDQDGNGKPDDQDAALKQAQDLVAAAEGKQTEAENALTEANKDGAINQTEHDDLTGKNQAVTEAKTPAQAAVDALPDGQEKSELQNRLDAVDGITVPAVNDQDGNGKPDDQDAALKQAQDLVAAAEGKQTEAENALTEANKDGAINQTEHDDLTGKNQAVTEAKTPAQAAVDALPDGQEKSELQNRLDAVDGITVPAVNDQDGNGKPDDQDAALKQAQDLVAAAEGKQTEAENALTEANKDGAINQTEHDDLTGKNQAVTEAKTPAQAAVDALPDGQEKSELQNRLDAVDGITVPAVNDQDGNGKPDDQDAALKQAQDLVAAAEGKQTEAENALTEANKDGAINQTEHDDLTGKNQAVTEAKTPAQAAVDALPDGQEKSELQNRLDAVDGITVPAVNDQDGNGKPDDQDAALKQAQDLVAAAEGKQTEAENALTEANKDGAINQTEHDDLTGKNQAVTEAKTPAQAAVDALPDGQEKSELQNRLDAVDGITVPAVNDQDGNGKPDDQDAALKQAQDLVAAAEGKQTEAENALTEANKDGAINQTEHDDLTGKNQAVTEAKTPAQAAVDALPDGQEKSELQNRLDAVDGITVPAVNDQDGNGKPDDQDAALKQAQDLVAAAEGKQTEAENALTEANKDGAINQTEHDDLTGKNQAVTEAKTPAQAAVDALPDGQEKSELQNRLDAVDGITVPAVNDQDGNGKPDDQDAALKQAQDLVAAAEGKQTEAENALTEANKDGAINQTEHDDLTGKNQAVTEAKTPAQAAVDALPDGQEKSELQNRLDAVDGITVPAVNDQDGNGKPDDQDAALKQAQDLVAAAEGKQTEAENALTEANKDGAINQTEHDDLTGKNQAVTEAKTPAQAAVDALPDGQEKSELQNRLDAVDGITVPAVNDQDGNGKPDDQDAALKQAQDLVAAAEGKQTEAENALTEANKDGAINQTEHDDLTGKNQAVTEAKTPAQAAVDALPDGQEKSELQNRLDAVDGITVPAVNDQDGNGKPDDQDAALKQAQDLVAAAEGKQTEAENALTEANKDGAINQTEHDDLTGKNQAVTEAKTPAQAAVDALPDGQEKSELQNRLDAVDGITVPAVNDQDGNGKPDDQDAALKQAQDLVAAAEGKQTEAENALTEANKDGAINQTEHDDLTGKNQAVTEAKTPAQAAVDALPDGQEKSELQNRLDAVDGITVPAVNDQDGNGKPDDQDAALKQAQDLVAAAEGKQTEAENALTEANKDGAINQTEHDDLTGKNQAVTEAKTPAQAAVDALPDGQEKSELQNRLDAVDGITVPAVNDQDGNGKPDDQDAALKQAQDLVAAAEGKQTEAENALTEANKDGAINQTEHDDLTGKNQAVTEAKTPAQAAVDALPDGQEKSELQNRLDAVDGITVPAVNDQDGNGKPDDQDAALKQAQDLVAAAEGKQTEAENALTEANKDGAINQTEHDDLTGKNQAVTEAKTPAQAAVDALPDGQEKSELQNRLDAVDGITVPAVNDQDGNGKPDDQDAALKQAQDLVAAAEGKQTEAENALTEANKDGAINQTEHDDLTGKNQAVTEAKTPAQAAVDALPDGQEKSELQNRLDAVDGITVPAVNDQDGNGKPDDQDAALKQAQDLVAAAEGKQTEAENALTEANKDGAINQTEHDDLTGKNQAVTEAKTPAQAAVDALPDGQEKSELQNRLDAVDGITVPAVNDQDGNGKPDDQDAALKQAQDLVAAAEGKQTEAENALTEANKDGAINQTEHDDLTGKNQAVTEAKTPAQAAVDALPDGQEKSELQNRLDAVDGITVPAVNDQDGNGKPDDQDAALKQAQDLVAAAEGKQTEAENALTEANKDGAINQTEHDDLTGKNQAVTEAKTPAQAAVDALPDGQEKSELQNRLDAVDGITVPAVNDQDGNGKPDDQDAALKQAQDLVAAAEGKQTEAENALTEANKDGAINQTEHDDLTGKNQAVTEAKTPAQAAVDALPDGQEKSELQNRLDAVDGITVPAVNDQDGNGKPDDQDAALKQAQDLVAAAEGKQTEAENALTEANKDGAINQTEHDDLTGKNQAVTEAKTPAQAAVDALPDGQEKSELQNRLDAVDGITVPAVNDQDGNGKPDDQDAALKQAQDLVAAAEGKQTEAENALTEANKDGAINQTEHDDLTGKNQAVTEAKTPAQAAVDALPDGQEKSELQNRLDAVDGITVPAVNDQDGNGKPDDQDAALKQAQDLVAAAEGKQTEAENALTEANKDGAINQTEHDDLTGKNQAVTEAKTPAQAAVDALPDGQEKSELQNRLDAVDGITVPAVNDQDGNGKPDDQDAALKQAQDLVAAAEGKQTEAENALTEANKDGAINQTEHDDLTGKNQAVTEAKTPAQAAVDALPDGQEKSELQNRLDAVDGITVPAVNDQDGNGKPDDQDAALKQAQDLVAAAEGKQTEAENALTEANKDGAINQTEHDDLTGKNQAVTEAKTPAQAAVDALPDGQEKSELQNRLDAVDGITVPAVNDQDGNGKPDDQDAALKQAQDLVAAAEGKQTEAENALTEANKDGAINQTEHDDLTGKNQAVTEAKTPAQAAVDALPDGQEKSELQNRLDAVDGITVPAVNDQDGNGKPDDQDAALKQAQDLVAAAEGKQTEAENALTEANKDGAINQTEHDDLTGKNQAVTEAKTPAQAAVDALPDGQEKSELQNRLDAVDGITVPAVNDQDGNGKPDDQDAALKQAQDLVAAAEGKQTEAENALTEANKDGAINQTEHDDLTGKNQAVTEAKTPAQAAVDALPDGQEKSELQNRLDAVDGITVPAVNDQDGNGKPDDQDAALKQAQDLVAAAEGKQTEAENALTEANKDGAINQTEHDDLTGKNQAVTEAKTPAQAAVDALPDGQEKSELQNRLDAVDGITVPAVNDQDGNGKPDDQDAALKQAQDLVAAAEGKQTEAENALTEANKDGAINQTEHDDLTGKNQAVTEAKTPAQAAVDALPDGQEKSELQNRLDAVDGITVPAVNDQDGNGKPDDQDAALKQAQDLVAAAEGKQTEAENALTEANKDGAINQTEHDDLTGKNQAVTEAKTPAQAAVDALPDGQEKSELQNRLDAVDGITVPAVNDQDGNGKPDDQDAALKQAQDLVAAAEGKQTEAEMR
ncbi:GA-like domain-containing protein [Escherichia coli]|uniref:GA-like domain-containing protein n=4 Tax=Escherichia coli TaxID=562 RepID=UPI0008F4CAFC|nr:hypothetical protein [Escherichia coli]OII83794.1 hypothetical protein BHF00_00050 [Escherichia coli]